MKTKSIKATDLLDYDLTHKNAGNGFAVVEILDDEYVRIAGYSARGVNSQAFLAWVPMLSITEQPIYKDPGKPRHDEIVGYEAKRLSPESLRPIAVLRKQIKQGTKKIIATHIQTT